MQKSSGGCRDGGGKQYLSNDWRKHGNFRVKIRDRVKRKSRASFAVGLERSPKKNSSAKYFKSICHINPHQ